MRILIPAIARSEILGIRKSNCLTPEYKVVLRTTVAKGIPIVGITTGTSKYDHCGISRFAPKDLHRDATVPVAPINAKTEIATGNCANSQAGM